MPCVSYFAHNSPMLFGMLFSMAIFNLLNVGPRLRLVLELSPTFAVGLLVGFYVYQGVSYRRDGCRRSIFSFEL